MEEFFTDPKSEPIIDRTLATVLISDIVDSTGQASDMGDRRWQDLMAAHKPIMRTE